MIYKDSIVLLNVIIFQHVTTGCLCTESLQNDRVELSDTSAVTLWSESSRNPAAVTFLGYLLYVCLPTLYLEQLTCSQQAKTEKKHVNHVQQFV